MRKAALWMIGALIAGASAPAIAASQPKSGGLQVRLLEAPETRRDDPRARIYIVDHVRPGDRITRRVGVANQTDARVRVTTYAAAATVDDGGFKPQDGRARNELTSWTTVTPATIDLAPGVEVAAQVTIAVPRAASAGERYGVVWAELPPSSTTGVGVVNRVGIRIYLSVGPGGEPPSDFVIEALTAKRAADRRAVVTATVRNTGRRALDLSGTLSLANGPAGLRAGPFPARLGTTLGVGASGPVTVDLDSQLPDGPWDATLDLRSGEIERTGTAQITFPATAGEGTTVRVGSARGGPVAVAAAVLALVLIAICFVLLAWRRRQPHDEDDAGGEPE